MTFIFLSPPLPSFLSSFCSPSHFGLQIGEIDFFCKLYMLKAALPELSEGKMKPFFTRMSELPGVKKVLEGDSKLGFLADYLVAMP